MEKVIAADAEKRSLSWSRVRGSKVWAFFSSLKLSISVLITLAVVSIFGTVIEQGQSPDTYLIGYGGGWGKLILFLSLDDMYHSAWFTAILVILSVNIVVCTLERFSPKWRTLLRTDPVFDPGIIGKLSNRDIFTVDSDIDTVKECLFNEFRKKRYRVKTFDSAAGSKGTGRSFYAWKGKMGRFGSDMTHVSLLLILLGAIIGSMFGYKDFSAVPVGGKVIVPGTDHELRLDKFWIDYYDTGQIRQFNSNLTIVRDGEDVISKQIWVNEPLYYEGIRFYQSSYGMSWNRIKEAEIVAIKRGEGGNEIGSPVRVKWGELKRVPDSPYSVKVVAYAADFTYDEELGGVVSKSAEANNPAVRVEVYEGDRLIFTPWLFFNFPGYFSSAPDSDYSLILAGFSPIPYSGISITKDPGTNIVWAGSIIMGIGFIFAFFVNYRRVWVNLTETGNSREVSIGGMTNKNHLAFKTEFKELVGAVRSGCAIDSSEGRK
jgi:cytochrome c biogenesis protein